jgi:spore germination protein KB
MLLTRLEYVISAYWFVTQLFIGIAFFYGGIAGLSELLGLKDHKPLILPFGLVATVMSGVLFPSTM